MVLRILTVGEAQRLFLERVGARGMNRRQWRAFRLWVRARHHDQLKQRIERSRTSKRKTAS